MMCECITILLGILILIPVLCHHISIPDFKSLMSLEEKEIGYIDDDDDVDEFVLG